LEKTQPWTVPGGTCETSEKTRSANPDLRIVSRGRAARSRAQRRVITETSGAISFKAIRKSRRKAPDPAAASRKTSGPSKLGASRAKTRATDLAKSGEIVGAVTKSPPSPMAACFA